MTRNTDRTRSLRAEPDAVAAAEAESGHTRRATLARLGVAVSGAAAASALVPTGASAAPQTGIYVVVDPSGGGDYTDLEAAIKGAPAGATIFVKRGNYVIQNRMVPKAGHRILG